MLVAVELLAFRGALHLNGSNSTATMLYTRWEVWEEEVYVSPIILAENKHHFYCLFHRATTLYTPIWLYDQPFNQ